MPIFTKKMLIVMGFAIGVALAAYNAWAERAYFSFTADREAGSFPFYHPVRLYGYVIESRIFDDSMDPIQSASRIAALIHGQFIAGVFLVIIAIVLWVLVARSDKKRSLPTEDR